GSQWVDTKARKKHAITRRKELIIKDNRYHSPELSETDPDEPKK
ncbi:36728_t:CDS:2, partial [Racocetra persica]